MDGTTSNATRTKIQPGKKTMHASKTSAHWYAAACYGALATFLTVVFSAQFLANDLPTLQDRPLLLASVIACLVVSMAGWIGIATFGLGVAERVGVEGLVTIGLVAGLHFAVTYTSMIGGIALRTLLGPLAIFITGIGDEAIPCLLLAVLLTLYPRPGTLMLTNLTSFVLNCVFGGFFGLFTVVFVTVSIVLGESALALARVTTGPSLAEPRATPTASIVARLALGVGLANALPYPAQYGLSMAMYRMHYETWYVIAVTLGPGLAYGAIGAAAGTHLGYKLRRTAR
jgi:hypothetical protein